jgi:hypothetical protein
MRLIEIFKMYKCNTPTVSYNDESLFWGVAPSEKFRQGVFITIENLIKEKF